MKRPARRWSQRPLRRAGCASVAGSRPVSVAGTLLLVVRPQRIMRILPFIILLVVAVGCSPTSSTRSVTTGTGSLGEARVLAIARAAVAMNDTWLYRAEFEEPKRQADGSWSVLVWRLPKTPGGHRFISIDIEGRVTQYGRGL